MWGALCVVCAVFGATVVALWGGKNLVWEETCLEKFRTANSGAIFPITFNDCGGIFPGKNFPILNFGVTVVALWPIIRHRTRMTGDTLCVPPTAWLQVPGAQAARPHTTQPNASGSAHRDPHERRSLREGQRGGRRVSQAKPNAAREALTPAALRATETGRAKRRPPFCPPPPPIPPPEAPLNPRCTTVPGLARCAMRCSVRERIPWTHALLRTECVLNPQKNFWRQIS